MDFGRYNDYFLLLGVMKTVEIVSKQIKFSYEYIRHGKRMDEPRDANEKQT